MDTPHLEIDGREPELIRAAQCGDMAAFKSLYECYRERIYNFAFYALGDQAWAEDVLQIIFMKMHRGLPDFRFASAFSTWLYRIALNECQNQQQRHRTRYVPLEAILGSEDECDRGALPDAEHARNERGEIIRQAVLELPPKLRTVVALKYLDGLSYDEIAAILGCSSGTVASRLNRALAKLEDRLRPLKRIL